MDNRPGIPRGIWIVIAVTVVAAALLVGIIATLIVFRSSNPATASTTQPASAAPARRPAQWNRPDVPRIARRGNPMTVEDDIVQRDDGTVFVHAGRGSFTAFPPNSKAGYQFGIRGAPDQAKPAAAIGQTLANRDSRQRLNLTPEQERQLDALGPYPQAAHRHEERDHRPL